MPNDNFLAHYGKKGMHWGIINEEKDESIRNPRSNMLDDIGAVIGVQGSVSKKETQELHKKAASEGIAYGERQAKAVGELISGRNKNTLSPEGTPGFRNSQVDSAVTLACQLLTKDTVERFNSGNYTTEDVKNMYQGATVFSSFLDQAVEYGGKPVSSALDSIKTISSDLTDLYTKIEKSGANPLEDPEYIEEERLAAEKIDAEINNVQTGLGMSRPDPKRSGEWTSDEQYQEQSWWSTHWDLAETMYLTGVSSARPTTQETKPDPNKRITYHQGTKAQHDDLPGDFLAHYGVAKRSGRYPYGSGERPFQSEPWRRKKTDRLKAFGSSGDSDDDDDDQPKKFRSKTREYRAKDMRNLTTEELKKRTERLRAENDYRQAVKANQTETASHRKQAVKKIFLDSMENAASEVMKTIYANLTKRFLNNTAPWLLDYKYTNDKSDSGKDEKKVNFDEANSGKKKANTDEANSGKKNEKKKKQGS